MSVNLDDATLIKRRFPQFREHMAVTPHSIIPKVLVAGEYVWTPAAGLLTARTRLAMRGKLSPHIDEESTEEPFPTLWL